MIINGNSRCNGRYFTRHLMNAEQNERVRFVETRGLLSNNVADAFREMELVASGTRCKNYFYHADLNPYGDERLTDQQWEQAQDMLERQLGFDGQPRFVVEHEKLGRVHRHVIWSRIDADSMTALSDSLTYHKHELSARDIEREFGLQPVDSVLVKDRGTPRPERRPKDWEGLRGSETRIDPYEMKREVTALWERSDTGQAFAHALEEAGYILCKGDSRDFCIVDAAGDEHSLARRIAGVKAAALRARMEDVDREALPSVAEGRTLARERADAASSSSSDGSAAARRDLQAEQQRERFESAFLQEPRADITADIERDLTARFGEERPAVQVPEPGQAEQKHAGGDGAQERGAAPAHGEEQPQWKEGEEPPRISSWGAAWRSFTDRVRLFAGRVAELWRDESSGLGPWLQTIKDRLVAAFGRHEGPEPHADISRDAADKESGPAQPEQEGRPDVLPDANQPLDFSWTLRHEQKAEPGGDPSRPSGNAEPEEPDRVPQEAASEAARPTNALDAAFEDAVRHSEALAHPDPEMEQQEASPQQDPGRDKDEPDMD